MINRRGVLHGGLLLAGVSFARLGAVSPLLAADAPKVGVLVALSGLGAQIGQWMLMGAETAADVVKSQGGPQIAIVAEDSQWVASKGVEGFNKLVDVDGVDVILSGGSSVMEAIAPLADQKQVVVMNVGAQSPKMAGIAKNVFSVLQLSDFDTGVLSKYARDTLGYKKMATLYVNNDTGTFNQASFAKGFEKVGGAITAQEAFKSNETTYGVQLAKIRASAPDALYIVGTPAEMPFAVKQARQMLPDLPILSYAGIESKEFLDAAGPAAEGVIYTTTAFDPASSDPGVKAFVDAYEARFKQKPTSPYATYGYDAVMIFAEALKASNGQAGEALRAKIVEAKRFPGVAGDNVFADNGTVAKAVAIRKVANGAFETVTVIEP
ncbi:branched-chain amino acid transport system substrate-binding protein [Rhodoligotrophos appendicifer]|uniref:ABC transporter substrate-binding protein n=1 Tax=Rhodoligotrophos appendicifer TaxID=987056 RepID=UPI0011847582|nr:ABC transporter substrate-binding protein [Rhodoligotrophos appendicifer]